MLENLRPRNCAAPVPGSQWHPVMDVLWCHTDTTATLFSLKTGHYYTLTGTGLQVWKLLCNGQTVGDIIDSIQRDVGAAERVKDDVNTLIASLCAAGLIQSGGAGMERPAHGPGQRATRKRQASAAHHTAVPSRTTCFVALAMFHVLLHIRSLKSVIVTAYVDVPHDGPRGDHAWSHELARRIESAAALYPFHADCLERSLTFLWFTRRAGINADLRIGVDPFPFEAHAWVECGGRPLNELEEALVRFTKFPPLSANWLAGVI